MRILPMFRLAFAMLICFTLVAGCGGSGDTVTDAGEMSPATKKADELGQEAMREAMEAMGEQ